MAAQEERRYAHRVTFEYAGDRVWKIAQQRIEMVVPPSHGKSTGEEVGFWYELRDGADRTVYRRVVQNPMDTTAEVFSPDGTIVRRPIQDPHGVFEIVVPEIANASSLVLLGTPQPVSPPVGSVAEERARPAVPRIGITPAREILRIDLSEDTK